MIRVFGGALLLASTVLGWPMAALGVSPIDADGAVREALAGNRDLQAALLFNLGMVWAHMTLPTGHGFSC